MDYTDPGFTLTISYGPGTMIGNIKCQSIEILDDTVPEDVERFNAHVATLDNSLIDITSPSQATIYILDHEDGKYNYRTNLCIIIIIIIHVYKCLSPSAQFLLSAHPTQQLMYDRRPGT